MSTYPPPGWNCLDLVHSRNTEKLGKVNHQELMRNEIWRIIKGKVLKSTPQSSLPNSIDHSVSH